MIDCIIVPEETLRELPERVVSGVDLLVVDNGSDCLQDSDGEVKGAFVPGDESTFLNPLDSLDLYNRGEWILFESMGTDSGELVAWVEQISSLLQLLPVTAAPKSFETPSGLILPSHHGGDKETDKTCSNQN